MAPRHVPRPVHRTGAHSTPLAAATGHLHAAGDARLARHELAATKAFGEYLVRRSDDLDARWADAIAFYYRDRFDNSSTQLRALETAVRTRGGDRVASASGSLAIPSYMQAVAEVAGGSRTRARDALQRALVEDLWFYRARMLLADLELADG